MSGNNYYYYPPNQAQPFGQNWNDWGAGQQPYNPNTYGRNQFQYTRNPPPAQHPNNANILSNRPQYNSYNENNHHYQPQRRFNNGNWQGYKRPRTETPTDNTGELRAKQTKKKKKPLSQNVPSKRAWSLQDSKAAFEVEKEFYKHQQNHSLIIKFPDLEISKELVASYNPNIDYVHFQQSCMPRYCFVTLKESANPDEVIDEINKIPFGTGQLKAEYKKDREKEQNIGPEDIDPLTLYVGNLNHNVTKEDIVKTYPQSRRIDIGYAKKMKFTRYAIVSFRNVADSIEAFKRTHNKDLNAKSLIVRFRRLNGSVGMPGESKAQSPTKKKPDEEARPDENGLMNNDQSGSASGVSQTNGTTTIKHELLDPDEDLDDQDSLLHNYNLDIELEDEMYLLRNDDDSGNEEHLNLNDNNYSSKIEIDLSKVKKEINTFDDECNETMNVKIKEEIDTDNTTLNSNKNVVSHKPLIEYIKEEPILEQIKYFCENENDGRSFISVNNKKDSKKNDNGVMESGTKKDFIKFHSLQEDYMPKIKIEPKDNYDNNNEGDEDGFFEINYDNLIDANEKKD